MNMNEIKKDENLKLLQITPGTIFFTEFASFIGENVEENGWLQKLGIPNPSSINWEGNIITNEEKNAKGDLFLEFVNKKRKITINWEFLTQSEYRTLFGHLGIDFNNREQAVLYYRIRALNPNTANYYKDDKGVLHPTLDEMIAYLSGNYTGKVKIYNNPQEVIVDGGNTENIPLMIGYQDVSLVFIER